MFKHNCAYPDCNFSSTVTHRFPKDPVRSKIWAQRAGRWDLLDKDATYLSNNCRLCTFHFHDRMYTSTERKRLVQIAVPEIFVLPTGEIKIYWDNDAMFLIKAPDIASQLEVFDEIRKELNLEEYITTGNMKPGVSVTQGKVEEDEEININYKEEIKAWNRTLQELSEMASRYCRLCAQASDNLVPVFSERGLELKLEEKIHTHLPIMVTPDDLMPVSLCMSCISKLEVCHQLVNCCLEADSNLRTMLKFSEIFEDESQDYDENGHGGGLQVDDQTPSENADIEMENQDSDSQNPDHNSNVAYEDGEHYGAHVVSQSPSDDQMDSASCNDPSVCKMEVIETDIANQAHHGEVIEQIIEENDGSDGNEDLTGDKEEYMEQGEQEENKWPISIKLDQNFSTLDISKLKGEVTLPVSKALNLFGDENFKVSNKPKYKVVVVKLKTSPDVSQDLQISKALQLLKTDGNEAEATENAEGVQEFRLAEQERSQSEQFPFECSTCGKTFQKIGEMAQHSAIHENVRQHKCQLCGKRFNRRGNMLVHLRRHQTANNFTCKICMETFDTFGEMLSHRKTHSKEEIERAAILRTTTGQASEIKCEICGKVLSTKISLRYHMMTHSGEKPYECDFCHKKFTMKTTLAYHRRTHTGEKPYQCRFCDDAFQSKQGLVIHERLHTGEKPFPCEHCPMAFRSRVNLNQHLVVHSEERPFTCPYCNRGFRRRDTLDVHVRTHTGERPYGCQVCGRRFKQKGDCNKHQKSHFKDSDVPIDVPVKSGRGAHSSRADQAKMIIPGAAASTVSQQSIQEDTAPAESYACALCGVVFDNKFETEQHFESFHSVGEGAPETIIISTDNIVAPENGIVLSEIAIVGNEQDNIILPDYATEADNNSQ
ncbi:zinc finger protein 250-like isoform X1 [Schistocerca cancellata]|uniref:zinc finger protein 250-like isoform X1 n=2 Tax=Schistocerca cancellata TaxID=274614 RepID=UPI0021186319|nr:zinc finger protein 250-like isoform X1 [Schistocerca cancellata]